MLTDTEKLSLLLEALDSRCLLSNPEHIDRAADEVDCSGSCESLSHEWDTNFSSCRKSDAGEYCANDLAETLRELASVARTLASEKAALAKARGEL